MTPMKTLRRLALAADFVALATVMLGSWTRINGAGETCPDWPLCHGRLVPSLADGTIWEWAHRLLAFSVTPLVIALLVVAWKQRRRSPFVVPVMSFIAVLFVVQVLLGAATVKLFNSPMSVVLHWGTAMAFVASLSAMAIFAAAAENADDAHGRRSSSGVMPGVVIGLTAAIAFVTMCVGAYVSSSGAGLACLDIPGCAGNVIVYGSGQFVQMLHRGWAAATLLFAAASLAVVWAVPASRQTRVAVCTGVALVLVQVLLGLLNVALRLPTDLREAHAVNAALMFLAFVVGAVFATLDSLRARATTAAAA
jgi:heme A synthase